MASSMVVVGVRAYIKRYAGGLSEMNQRYPDKTDDDKTYYVKTATTKRTLNKTDTRQNRHDNTATTKPPRHASSYM